MRRMIVSGLTVEVVRKDIKNLHLGVYPPNGRVRVAAPKVVNDEAVRLAVIGKLGWIKKQRAAFEAQPRQPERQMVNGESHYFMGRRYRLKVLPHEGAAIVLLRANSAMELHVRRDATTEQRLKALNDWYRAQLKALVPPLLERWQKKLGVAPDAWGVKKMKTKWGSCNTTSKRVWLNLELAKKPLPCLEYILVHELAHLRVRRHDTAFTDLMDKHLPGWKQARSELNRAPLGHEEWAN